MVDRRSFIFILVPLAALLVWNLTFNALFDVERVSSAPLTRPPPGTRIVAPPVPAPMALSDLSFSFRAVRSRHHPSCLAEALIRENAAALGEYWKEYRRREWNCYKHGGHYNPGIDRSPRTARRLVMRNVVYHNGRFLALRFGDTAGEKNKVFHYSAYFPMVSGNWPQPIVDEFLLEQVNGEEFLRQYQLSLRVFRFGYFQPPTDFLSVYHTVVETVMPTFHLLADEFGVDTLLAMANGTGTHSVQAVSSRPSTTRYKFKQGGCALSAESCLQTVWGSMFLQQLGGTNGSVIGMRRDEPQIRFLHKNRDVVADAPDLVLFFETFFVGNPTHCEPLWGPDAFFTEALSQEHRIRGARSKVRRLKFTSSSESRRQIALSTVRECSKLLWSFRQFHILSALQTLKPRSLIESKRRSVDLAVSHKDPIHVVFTSRKGDWARQLLNEDLLLEALTKHLREKYPHRRPIVRAVRFSGSLSEQLLSPEQLDLTSATLYIGNHGANLLNGLYLRPNAGVVTLSLRNPGFWPTSVFPSWLHWRDIVVEQMCNRRLSKGKCRWMEGNNNDMFLSDQQLTTLLRMVDEIVDAQEFMVRRLPL